MVSDFEKTTENCDEEFGIEKRTCTDIYDIKGDLVAADDAKAMINKNFDLIEKSISGDKKAFDELYLQSYRHVFFTVRQYIADDETTYDAIQETFIKVYKNISNLSNPNAYYGWISSIAKNTAIDILRTTKFETKLSYEESDDNFCSEKEKEKDVSLDVATVLKKLDPQDADLLSLVYYDGLRVSQIAKMQDVPATTVYSRLNKAKKNLKAQLAVHGIDKAIYSGNFVAMITTAIRNIIGTAILSFSVAQQILNSVIGKKSKKELAIEKIILLHQKKLALKIASCLVAVCMVASCFTVLALTDWGKAFTKKFGAAVKETVETIVEYHYYEPETPSNTSSVVIDENGVIVHKPVGDNSSKNDNDTSKNSSSNIGFWESFLGIGDKNSSNQSSPHYNVPNVDFTNGTYGEISSENTTTENEYTSSDTQPNDNTSSDSQTSIPSHAAPSSSVSSVTSSTPTPLPTLPDGFVPDCDESQYNVLGNEYSNVNVVTQGDWIYYSSATYSTDEDGGLYKVKKDGTDKQRIRRGNFSSVSDDNLSVVGPWIYYKFFKTIYRISTDGTSQGEVYTTTTTDITAFQIYDNMLYFETRPTQSSPGEWYKLDLTTLKATRCDATYFTDKYRIVLESDYDGKDQSRYAIYSLKTGALAATISTDYGSVSKCYNSALIIGGYVFDLNNLSAAPVYMYRDVKDYTKVIYYYSPYKGGCIGGWFGKISDGYFYAKFSGTIYKSDLRQQAWPFSWECIERQVQPNTTQYAVLGEYIYFIEGTKLHKILPDGTNHTIM